MNLGMPR
jgi:ribonuclease HI